MELQHGFCELFWCVVSGSGMGPSLGLGLLRTMLGPVYSVSPSIWVLVRCCRVAAVAQMPEAAVGPRCIIPWGGAKWVMVPSSAFGRIWDRQWGKARPLPWMWWMCNHW